MHGRTLLLALALAGAAFMPAAATASPIPPGIYDVQLTGGALTLGSLPPQTLSAPTSFPLTIGTSPASAPLTMSVPDVDIKTSAGPYAITGKLSTTLVSATGSIDPVAQSASLDVSFYATLSLTATALGTSTGGGCTLGSADQPVALHLTTADGTPWDAATGKFGLADKSFALPAPSCSPALIGSVISLITGNTGAGHNIASIAGLATRRPDMPAAAPTAAPGGTAPQTTTGPPATPTTTGSTAAACVVPKLVGKRLPAAKRALRAAGCRAGKLKRATSGKKKGLVVGQGRRAGVKLPAGSKVALTVSRGKSPTRKRHSR